VHLQPKRVAITGGYHGVHAIIQKLEKVKGSKIPIIGIDDEYEEGDVCWLETPLNPTGLVRDIKYYAEKAHKKGVKVVVDATFAPPPLQDPFKWGADMVMHSGTSFLRVTCTGHCVI
jgi:cystathionine gamma-synthase